MKQFLALKASAGSGKTFALTVRYISLLVLDINPTEILTLTFTNKAALEMSQRIYQTLLQLGDDNTILEAISIQTNMDKGEVLLKKETIIDKFISYELSIYTLDKFINKILREFSGYIDINDTFKIDNDDEDLMLYNFLISLDTKQFDLLTKFSHKYGKKLLNIVEIFKTLDEKNEELTIIDFDITINDKIISIILESALKIKTFILNANVSNSAKKAVDFNTLEELLDKGKTWLTKDSLNEFTYFKKAKCPNELDDELDNIKHNITLYYKYSERSILNQLFTIFNNFKAFRLSYKKNKNSFEFRDITNLVFILLSKIINKDFLYFRLDIKYNHILIDEFQDTSTLQYKILEPLIDEILSGYSEKFRTFFYVGDIKQSIYRFRGGTKELFDFVHNKYSSILELETLDTNYRSGKNVVKFVNNIFKNIPNYDYDEQKVNSDIKGMVKITNFNIEDKEIYVDIKNELSELFAQGVNPTKIAILTYRNKDILELYKYLTEQFPTLKIITELTSKLINQINIKIVINMIKYLYFNEDIYKVNFNSLMGYNISEEIELKLNLKTNKLQTIVDIISNQYNLIDDNMIKFIDLLTQYEDIVDFIYEIENNDATMVNKEKDGLQLLTVFKSKGLEFDNVIVLDRIRKKNADRSILLFEYDDINLNNIYYKSKFRENFDEEYRYAIENEKQLSIGDELNILYVALTRAKYNLIVFKKEKQSVFDILKYDFTSRIIGDIYIKKEEQNNTPLSHNIKYLPVDLGLQDIQKKDIIDSLENIKAKYIGLATHYCLEMLKEFDLKSLDTTINIVKTKYSNYLEDNDIEYIYNIIKSLLLDNTFLELISNSTYSKEQELIYNNDIKIIDLLIEKESRYIVIDYKTSKEVQQSHISQVNYYKKAISSIFNSIVDGYLVYLDQNKARIIKV